MNRSTIIWGAALATSISMAKLGHAECTLQFITPVDSRTDTGLVTVNFGEADDPLRPQAWQGPVQAGRCVFKDGIIEEPIALAPRHRLFVTAYSGSERHITLYDLNTCSIVWRSDTFVGKLALTPTTVQLGEDVRGLDAECVPGKKADTRGRAISN
jgi:hypothetical protein